MPVFQLIPLHMKAPENNKLVTIANEMDGISTGFIVLRSSNMDHITNQDLKITLMDYLQSNQRL